MIPGFAAILGAIEGAVRGDETLVGISALILASSLLLAAAVAVGDSSD
jgi:hypothetical protein